MAYDNNIQPGRPPLMWSEVKEAFDKINENFTIIGSAIARTSPINIAHVELSNPVRVVNTEDHNYEDGQAVTITLTGISQLDNNTYYIKVDSVKEFTLYTDEDLTSSVNGAGYDAYSSGGGQSQGVADFTALDFTSLVTDLIPAYTDTYNIGSESKRWGTGFFGESVENTDAYERGIWLGTAHIRGENGVIDLPLGSTVNGDPIIDTNKTFFKEVQVDNDQVVVASDFVDSLNLISGTAIQMTVDSGAESITIDNIGVTRLTGSTGISVSAATGNITLTNSGVTSISNSASLPDPGLTVGSGIAADTSTGAISLTNTGVIDVDAGFGITVSRDDATGIVTVSNAAPAQVAFRTFFVDGTNPVTDTIIADSTSDTLTLVEGYGISMTTTPATDTLQIDVKQDIDIYGSVFAQDSTLLVDSIDGLIVGNVKTDVIRSPDGSGLAIYGTEVNSTSGGNGVGIFGGSNTGTGDGGDVVIAGGASVGGDGGDVTILGGIGVGGLISTIRIQSAGDILIGTSVDDGTTIGSALNAANNTFYGTTVGEHRGSVFADDSTMLIDGTNGTIVGDVASSAISLSQVAGAAITLESINAPEIANGDGSIRVVFFGDDYSPGTAQLYVQANDVWLYSSLRVENGITGDLKGSVFADDSTTIVDSVNSALNANSVTVNSVYADEVIGTDGSGDLTIKGGNSSGNAGIVTLYGGSTIGASPNIDGYVEVTGPGFRVAVTNVPSDSTGQEGDKQGMVAVDGTSIYYCIADWASPGTANIWVKQDWGTTGAW